MITYLKGKGISADTIKRLTHYIDNEEFDTDSLFMDTEMDLNRRSSGNIAQAMKDDTVITAINSFMENSKS